MSTTSMTDLLLDPLNRLQHLSQELFHSLSPAPLRPPQIPSAQSLVQVDADLAAAIHLTHLHAEKQRKIEALKRDALQMDEQWRVICKELETGRLELSSMIEEADKRIESIESAARGSIPYPELLTYAQSLSAFTSAPPNISDMSLPGQPPPPLFFPPFPNEEKMRRGRLNAEAPLGLPGETHSVGRPPTVSPLAANAHQEIGPHPYRHDHRPHQPLFDLDLDLNPDL